MNSVRPRNVSVPSQKTKYPCASLLCVTILVILLVPTSLVSQQPPTILKKAELGPVSASIVLSPGQPLIGDEVELKIQVIAEKDVEVLMPAFGEALDRFSIIDFVPRESINEQGQNVATQKYRLRPPMSGEQSIPPILIEFIDRRPGHEEAPKDADAYELMLPRIDFEVKSVVAADATNELKAPLGKLERDSRQASSRLLWGTLVALAVLTAVVVLVFYWHKNRSVVRQRSAYEIARQRLDQLIARPLPPGEQVDAFFVDLSDIVRRYLEDRFNLRAPELTTEEFLETVSDSPDLSQDHQGLLREFLKQADLVKFAGLQPDQTTIRRSIEAADRFIQDTRLTDTPNSRSHPEAKGETVRG